MSHKVENTNYLNNVNALSVPVSNNRIEVCTYNGGDIFETATQLVVLTDKLRKWSADDTSTGRGRVNYLIKSHEIVLNDHKTE